MKRAELLIRSKEQITRKSEELVADLKPFQGRSASLVILLAYLNPDFLLLIHCHHTITDHVVHEVLGLDVLLQLGAEAQQTAPCPLLQRHRCRGQRPFRR